MKLEGDVGIFSGVFGEKFEGEFGGIEVSFDRFFLGRYRKKIIASIVGFLLREEVDQLHGRVSEEVLGEGIHVVLLIRCD